MISALAVSPVAEIATLLAPAAQPAAVARLGIADVSATARYGCKGPGTVAWLESLSLPVPPQPNSWLPLDGGGLIARLGFTEFMIEGPDALIVGGSRLDELLRQTCNVNFRPLDPATRPVVLTSMVGVGVTVIPEVRKGLPAARIWCDGTYGHYLWETLLGIAVELGGGNVAAHHFN